MRATGDEYTILFLKNPLENVHLEDREGNGT
jgi:hypothetical protein